MFLRVMTSLYLASGGVPPPPTNLPPTVSIVTPSSGATVEGSITISADISDADGVSTVSYRVDGGSGVPMARTSGDDRSGRWQAALNTLQLADGQHQIAVVAVDTLGRSSSPFVTVNVRNSTQQTLHVERIDVVLIKKGGSRLQARGDVFVYDAFGVPVPGAVVTGHWTGAANDTFTVTTDATGKAVDYSNSGTAPSGSVFTCVVDTVSKAGWVFSSAGNNEGSVTVP
jgi:hypothetical protein